MAILGFIFAATVVAVGLYSAVLLYHWIRYGFLYPQVVIAAPIYGVGVIIFLSIMFSAITAL